MNRGSPSPCGISSEWRSPPRRRHQAREVPRPLPTVPRAVPSARRSRSSSFGQPIVRGHGVAVGGYCVPEARCTAARPRPGPRTRPGLLRCTRGARGAAGQPGGRRGTRTWSVVDDDRVHAHGAPFPTGKRGSVRLLISPSAPTGRTGADARHLARRGATGAGPRRRWLRRSVGY